MSDVRLAIVGSTRFAHGDLALVWARSIIVATIRQYEPEVVISGGAAGIDTLARQIAGQHHYRFIEHLPTHPRWEPDGYKARNLLIAQDATHLLAIRCHASTTYGSGWTANQAEKLGRAVCRVVL